MMRNYLNDESAKRTALQVEGELEKHKDSDYIMKLLAVQSALKGISTSEIAKCFHVTDRAVQLWVKKTITDGCSALKRKKGSGRPAKLNSNQLYEINDWLNYYRPSEFDPDAKEWTGELLSRAILAEFDIDLSPQWCNNFMKNGQYNTPNKKAERKANYGVVDKLMEQVAFVRKERDHLMDQNKRLKEKLKKYEHQ